VPTDSPPTRPLLDAPATERLIADLAERIDASAGEDAHLVLIGIHRRGDSIARRIAEHLVGQRGPVPTGSLDITLYRDDFAQLGSLPSVGTTSVPEEIDRAHVVIVDDVLYTGRTIRAAINELSDFGRAGKIELCVLVDRGGRQLPIQPDYVGHRVEVGPGEQISVRVADLDGDWGVDIVTPRTGIAGAPTS
jgi:pyrimidine operon attenuation protein/uracil phosphoribosyltransferase